MKILRFLTSLVMMIWGCGYFWFINITKNYEIENKTITDTIIIFGGDKQRLYTGMQLVKNGYAPRMIIVGESTEYLISSFVKEQNLAPNMVILDQRANNLEHSYAQEAIRILRNYDHFSARIVAPSEQVNRAIVEMKAGLSPKYVLVPHPISPRKLNYNQIFVEYNKFLYTYFATLSGYNLLHLSYS